MPRLPRVTARAAERALRADGWSLHHSRGSHDYFAHPTKPGLVTLAQHAGRIIKPGTLHQILEQAGLTVEQFRTLL